MLKISPMTQWTQSTAILAPNQTATSLDFGELCVGGLGGLAGGSDWLVGLASGSVDGLHPQGPLGLIVSGENRLVSFPDDAHKELTSFYACGKFIVGDCVQCSMKST